MKYLVSIFHSFDINNINNFNSVAVFSSYLKAVKAIDENFSSKYELVKEYQEINNVLIYKTPADCYYKIVIEKRQENTLF